MSTLILLRHGHSEWNAKNLFTGWVDVDLNEQGLAEASRGAELLADAFQSSYWVAFAVLLATLIPVYFLPRKREPVHLLDDEEGAAPVIMH